MGLDVIVRTFVGKGDFQSLPGLMAADEVDWFTSDESGVNT